jgi:signal transduction histidine kinase
MKEELQAQIIEYQKLLISEQIKQEEFDELVEDLLDLDKLDAKLKNEKLKIQAKELVELVKSACNLM